MTNPTEPPAYEENSAKRARIFLNSEDLAIHQAEELRAPLTLIMVTLLQKQEELVAALRKLGKDSALIANWKYPDGIKAPASSLEKFGTLEFVLVENRVGIRVDGSNDFVYFPKNITDSEAEGRIPGRVIQVENTGLKAAFDGTDNYIFDNGDDHENIHSLLYRYGCEDLAMGTVQGNIERLLVGNPAVID